MKKIIPKDVARYLCTPCDIEERKKMVIYENDLFICVKDIKHIDEDDYHYTAWCKKDIRSLLDLERKHLKYIKNLKKAMYQKYQLTDEYGEFYSFPSFILASTYTFCAETSHHTGISSIVFYK